MNEEVLEFRGGRFEEQTIRIDCTGENCFEKVES
jgi:hypothetical protein